MLAALIDAQVAHQLAVQGPARKHALVRQARYDPLTGLANRRHGDAYLEQQFKLHGATNRVLAIAILDLDNLKAINDRYSHIVGDMVLRQVAVMTAIGAVIGLAAGFAGGRGASAIMYEMNGFDPVVFAAATLLLSLVSLAAGFIPAMRASRIDPIQALRYE